MSTVTPFLNLVKPAPLENFSRATYNNNLDLIDTGLINADKQAKGLLYQNIVTSPTAQSSDAIASTIATFTFKAGRKYRIVWDFSYVSSGDATSLFYYSVNFAPTADPAASVANLTLIHGRTKASVGGTNPQNSTQNTGPVIAYYNPSSDITTQIKFRLLRVVGGNLVNIVGNANEPHVYSIFDDGAQF